MHKAARTVHTASFQNVNCKFVLSNKIGIVYLKNHTPVIIEKKCVQIFVTRAFLLMAKGKINKTNFF